MDNHELRLPRREALAAGFTDEELRRLCDRGSLVRLRPGEYADGGRVSAMTPEQRHLLVARATLEGLPPEAALSHVTCAVAYQRPVWNIDLSLVHVTRAASTGRQTARTHVHSAPLDESWVRTVGGMRVTAPARMVIDLARTVRLEQAVAVGDSALHDQLVDRRSLEAALLEGRCRHGIGAARRAVGLMDERSESVGESRSRIIFARNGVPPPELQVDVLTQDGEWLARVDFCWKKYGVIGEFDGLGKYRRAYDPDKTPEEIVIAEKLREDALRAAGWLVIRWTWSDLANPANLHHRLRAAFAAGSPTGLFTR